MVESGLAFVLFKGLLGFGVPLGFALQQLWSLRREEERARERALREAPLLPDGVPLSTGARDHSPAPPGAQAASRVVPA